PRRWMRCARPGACSARMPGQRSRPGRLRRSSRAHYPRSIPHALRAARSRFAPRCTTHLSPAATRLDAVPRQRRKRTKNMATRVALVTGGTGGIGTAICKRLADQGHKVATNYRNEEKARAWEAHMKADG